MKRNTCIDYGDKLINLFTMLKYNRLIMFQKINETLNLKCSKISQDSQF